MLTLQHSVTKIIVNGAYTFLPKGYGSRAYHKNMLNPSHLHILQLPYSRFALSFVAIDILSRREI